MDEEKYLITDQVIRYKKEHTKENYKEILKLVIENADRNFCIPVDIRLDKNALELKTSFFDNKSYIPVYSSPEQMAGKRESEMAFMSIEAVIKKLLSSDEWDGLWLNPDPFITPENKDNQCTIPKEDIIKMINKIYK